VSKSLVGKVINGEKKPSADFVISIAQVFGWLPEELIDNLRKLGIWTEPPASKTEKDNWWISRLTRAFRNADKDDIETCVLIIELTIQRRAKMTK
jgi:hypothetical protein